MQEKMVITFRRCRKDDASIVWTNFWPSLMKANFLLLFNGLIREYHFYVWDGFEVEVEGGRLGLLVVRLGSLVDIQDAFRTGRK